MRRSKIAAIYRRRCPDQVPFELIELGIPSGSEPAATQTAPNNGARADTLYTMRIVRDHGDFYWSGAEKVSLWRTDDELVIGFDAASSSAEAIESLTGSKGILAGYEVTRRLGPDTVLLSK